MAFIRSQAKAINPSTITHISFSQALSDSKELRENE
jgi:hypothetical protein